MNRLLSPVRRLPQAALLSPAGRGQEMNGPLRPSGPTAISGTSKGSRHGHE